MYNIYNYLKDILFNWLATTVEDPQGLASASPEPEITNLPKVECCSNEDEEICCVDGIQTSSFKNWVKVQYSMSGIKVSHYSTADGHSAIFLDTPGFSFSNINTDKGEELYLERNTPSCLQSQCEVKLDYYEILEQLNAMQALATKTTEPNPYDGL